MTIADQPRWRQTAPAGQEICIWCPDRPRIPAAEFDAHLDRAHPEISDPRTSESCWSRAEVGTPDGIIREIACGRGRHRWGRHRNDDVRWSCPPRCACVRHPRQATRAINGGGRS